MFSRTLKPGYWKNALAIQKALKDKVQLKLHVHTWELLDKSFTYPRIRHYDYV